MANELTPGAPAGKQMKLSEATKMVESYASGCGSNDLRSMIMSASLIRKIIDQPDCEYIRVFFALDDNAAPDKVGVPIGHTLVFVGADAKGGNIKHGEDDSQVYEDANFCPPYCGGGGENL